MPNDKSFEILTTAIALRRYQEEAVNAINRFICDFDGPDELGIVTVPTGGGKTVIKTTSVANFLCKHDGKVIIVAPDKELLLQIMSAFQRVFDCTDSFRRIGNFTNHPILKKLKDDLNDRVYFITPHSWNRADKSKYKALKRRPLLICIDEAHWGINAKMVIPPFLADPKSRV